MLFTTHIFRASLCKALVTAGKIQDKSSLLLTTLTNSLLLSFSPTEVISDGSKLICSTALLKIASLARRGYLEGSKVTAQSLADLISAYTLKNTSGPASGQSGVAFASTFPVTTAASNLIQGVQLGMASGEESVSLVSSNVQLAVSSALITGTGSSTFVTPATASQSVYGAIQPRITIGPGGLSTCSFTSGYAQVSVLQWASNPYPASTAVKSPLLRIAVKPQTKVITTKTSVTSQVQRSNVAFSLPGVPAYYIALQYSTRQKFNFSAIVSNTTATTRGKSNFTLPACTLYNGVAYVPCKSCNISSYTDFNVTYGCFDITQLCPSNSIVRYLRHSGDETFNNFVDSINENTHEESEKGEEEEEEEEEYDRRQYKRHLTVDDDASVTSVSASTYGVLLESIKAELFSVLSSNPFQLNISQSIVVLTFVGCLGGVILIMLVSLLRVDHKEVLYKTYVKSGANSAAKKLLEKDLLNGGKGDLSLSFQDHLKVQNDSIKAGKSIKNVLRRSTLNRLSISMKGEIIPYLLVNEHLTDKVDNDEFCNDDDNDDDDDDIFYDKRNLGKFKTAAMVTEFAHNLFPSGSIFSKKRNIFETISVHHDYFAMFAGSTLNQSRTIRFLHLVAIILTSMFVDTVFFGIYFPGNSTCTSMDNKVRLH